MTFTVGQEITLKEHGWISEGGKATVVYALDGDRLVVSLHEPIPGFVQPAFKHLNLLPGQIVVSVQDVTESDRHA